MSTTRTYSSACTAASAWHVRHIIIEHLKRQLSVIATIGTTEPVLVGSELVEAREEPTQRPFPGNYGLKSFKAFGLETFFQTAARDQPLPKCKLLDLLISHSSMMRVTIGASAANHQATLRR